MRVTVITKFDGYSSEIYVAVVSTPLAQITEEQRLELRREFDCDGVGETDEDDEDVSNLFFREVEVTTIENVTNILNVDGERGALVDPNDPTTWPIS